jgi:hypothetical protein
MLPHRQTATVRWRRLETGIAFKSGFPIVTSHPPGTSAVGVFGLYESRAMRWLPHISDWTSDRWRRRGCGLLVSLFFHSAAIMALAGLARNDAVRGPAFVITSASEPIILADAELRAPLENVVPVSFSPDAGGSGSADVPVSELFVPAGFGEALLNIGAPEVGTTAIGSPAARTGKGSRVGRGRADQGGHGTGAGSGVGPGSGPGFFGITPPPASRVVFVVDNSRSMNHPHESDFKTRFRRVKFELVKCIVELKPSQSFYVVFFSNETLPMPGTSLQSAHPLVRDPYLKWIGEANPGGGPTDPRNALKLALQLEPDVICLLTDGEFARGVNRQLETLRQDRTQIHTFAIGDTLGEEILKVIAANNRGEYRFVP